jgi:phosphoenolpyruvate carboxykinase (GTP)
MTEEAPEKLQSWLRTERYPDSGFEAAHPNSRFTVPAKQCPIIDPNWESKEGVPISAIVFGGRRSTTIPLVYQSFDWIHGTFVGAMMNSETTAAAVGKRGVLRPDPFAMRPFCGYNMGDYFAHWLSFQKRADPNKLPKIFHVNWFRKSNKGKFLWPGFGDNIRVIDWILDRCDATDPLRNAVETPIGYVPAKGGINLSGLNLDEETEKELFSIDNNEWKGEVTRGRQFFANFKDRVPPQITEQLDKLEARLSKDN